jgi:hypothetical protein
MVDVPTRSLQQRMEALSQANEVRTYRAILKRDLKAGRVNVVDLLVEPPEMIETMKIFDLMMAVPKLGRTKVNRILSRCRISTSKTIDGMSARQRDELVHILSRR